MRIINSFQSLRSSKTFSLFEKLTYSFVLMIFSFSTLFSQRIVEICPGDQTQLRSSVPYESISWRDTLGNKLEIEDSQGVMVADSAPLVSPLTDMVYVARIVDPTATNLIATGDFETAPTDWQTVSDYQYIAVPNDFAPDYNRGFFTIADDAQELFDSAKHLNGTPAFEENWYQPIQDHTTGTGNMFVANGSAIGDSKVYVDSVDVVAGNEYMISAWFANIHSEYSNPYNMDIYVDGDSIGNLEGYDVGGWYQHFSFWEATETKRVSVEFKNITVITNQAGNDFAIDDILFAPVISDTIKVVVKQSPEVVVNDTAACFGEGLSAINSTVTSPMTLNIDSIRWSAPAGFLDDEQAQSPAMSNPNQPEGKYYVTLTAYAENGCFTVSDNALIAISDGAEITVSDTALCFGAGLDEIDLKVMSLFPITSYIWSDPANILDNVNALAPGLLNSDQALGSYKVLLTMTDSVGCETKSDSATVQISDAPSVVIYDTSTCYGSGLDSIRSVITSNSAIDRYEWTAQAGFFNDVSLLNPDLADSNQSVGSYPVYLTVYNNIGCEGISNTADIDINGNPEFKAIYDTSTCSVGNPQVIRFEENHFGTASYIWLGPEGFFEDSTLQVPVIAGDQTQGGYYVRLMVTDANGCMAISDSAKVEIGNVPQVTIPDTAVCYGVGLDFIQYYVLRGADSLNSADIAEYNWSTPWEFLDDSTSSIPVMANTEQDTGLYMLRLSVSLNNGCKGAGYGNVRILGNPEIVIEDQEVKLGEGLTLESNVVAGSDYYTGDYMYLWKDSAQILNDTLVQSPGIVDELRSVGDHTLSLIITDDNGCKDTASFLLVIRSNTLVVDLPDAFRPSSSSGNNSTVYVEGVGIKELKSFEVFNRWGNLIYKSDDINEGWDGHYKGKLLPTGAYGYQLTVISYDGAEHYRKGTILLLH